MRPSSSSSGAFRRKKVGPSSSIIIILEVVAVSADNERWGEVKWFPEVNNSDCHPEPS